MRNFFRKDDFLRIIKYGIVGVLGVLVNYSFLFLFYNVFGFYYLISAFFAIEISIISNFILNHIWTFKDRKNKENIFLKFLKFNFFSAGGIIINLLILRFLKEDFGFNLYFAEFFGILAGFSWNFIFSNFFVWRKK